MLNDAFFLQFPLFSLLIPLLNQYNFIFLFLNLIDCLSVFQDDAFLCTIKFESYDPRWPEYLQFVDNGNFSFDGDIRLPNNFFNLTTTILEIMQGSGIVTFILSRSDIQNLTRKLNLVLSCLFVIVLNFFFFLLLWGSGKGVVSFQKNITCLERKVV